jgi:peptidoglycan/LPS O-acetylase OafA/YrhL
MGAMVRRKRTSRRQSALRFLGWLVVSILYYAVMCLLLLFGYIVGWDNEPGRPVIGSAMIVAGLAIFVLGPRMVRRLTGKEPLTPPPGA